MQLAFADLIFQIDQKTEKLAKLYSLFVFLNNYFETWKKTT